MYEFGQDVLKTICYGITWDFPTKHITLIMEVMGLRNWKVTHQYTVLYLNTTLYLHKWSISMLL